MQSSGTPVKILVKTEVNRDGKEEIFELTVFGKYYRKNNTTYFIYDEVMEHGNVHTVVKMTESEEPRVQISRKGAVNMRLFFQENKVMTGTYKTNIANFKAETGTEKIHFEWDDERKEGIMMIKYHFFMQDVEVGTYKLEFTFKEDQVCVS